MRAIRFFRNSIFPLFCALVLLQGCKTTSVLTGFEIGKLYSANEENTLQVTSTYNLSDSLSTITVLIPSGQYTAAKAPAYGKLIYEVVSIENRPKLVDSATFLISDTSRIEKLISHSWDFKAIIGKNYYVKVAYTLPGSGTELIALRLLRKNSALAADWYRFQSEDGGLLMHNVLTYPHKLRLKSEKEANCEIWVKVYSRTFDIPLPPFIEEYRNRFNYTPDSVFKLQLTNGISEYFTPVKKGFYFFQADTGKFEGPTLFLMDPEFPKVNTHKTMIETLRYISSNADYRKLMSYSNPKMAIDSFWIASAGRPDLATEFIKKYYTRVMKANELFTSYTPGWKTDRGMIYVVMGKPTQVFRSKDQEVWIYGEYNDPQALRLYFDIINNPFTVNDFILNRHEYFKNIWYQNVQLWRR